MHFRDWKQVFICGKWAGSTHKELKGNVMGCTGSIVIFHYTNKIFWGKFNTKSLTRTSFTRTSRASDSTRKDATSFMINKLWRVWFCILYKYKFIFFQRNFTFHPKFESLKPISRSIAFGYPINIVRTVTYDSWCLNHWSVYSF